MASPEAWTSTETMTNILEMLDSYAPRHSPERYATPAARGAWAGTPPSLARSISMERRREPAAAAGAADGEGASAAHVRELESLNVDLRDRITFLTRQLNAARAETHKVAEERDAQETRARNLETTLQESRAREAALAGQIDQAQSQVWELSQEQAARTAAQQDAAEGLRERERSIGGLQTRVAALEDTVERLRAERDALRAHGASLEKTASAAAGSQSETQRQLDRALGELRHYRLVKLHEQQLHTQAETLQIDNARLLRLLKTTSEYQRFCEYWEDSRGMVYAPPAEAGGGGDAGSALSAAGTALPGGSDERLSPEEERRLREWREADVISRDYPEDLSRVVPKLETGFWLPSEAVRVTSDFKHRHLPHVAMPMMTGFLKQLNEIWRKREKRHVARVKRKYVREIRDLRRRLSQTRPYDKVVRDQTIHHLKRSLQTARYEAARATNSVQLTAGVASVGVPQEHILEQSLAAVEELSRQLTDLARENVELREEVTRQADQLAAADGAPEDGGGDAPGSRGFVQGALWSARHGTLLVDVLVEDVSKKLAALEQSLVELEPSRADYALAVVRATSQQAEEIGELARRAREKSRQAFQRALAAAASKEMSNREAMSVLSGTGGV